MMDFSGSAGARTNFDLIPHGQLAFAIFSLRGIKQSQSGGQYLDVELTLDDGQPFARRKIFDMIMDPNFESNSDAAKQMGNAAIGRILEAGRNAGPHNPQGYVIGSYEQLNGLRVAVKLKVEKGTEGYDDKNRVAEYLTPNPASPGNKGWVLLSAGQYNTNPNATQGAGGASGVGAPAAQPGLFGRQPSPATAPAPQTGGWGGGQPSPQSPQTPQGFQQSQPGAPAPGFQQPQGGQPVQTGGQTAAAPTAPQGASSPSSQPQTPGWLAQAQQQG